MITLSSENNRNKAEVLCSAPEEWAAPSVLERKAKSIELKAKTKGRDNNNKVELGVGD